MRERLIYGDDPGSGLTAQQTAAGNLLGKLLRHYDEAGLLNFIAYDFKGNLLDKQRQVISANKILSVFAGIGADGNVKAYRVNWAPDGNSSPAALQAGALVFLDPQVYETSSAFDALNRIKTLRYPQDMDGMRKELRPTYNRAGTLERVTLDGAVYVERIAYTAKGQRALIAYGNSLMTRYAYDERTFRLVRLRTERFTSSETLMPAGMVLQDFAYVYDLAGNIWTIHDRTPESGIPNTQLGTEALDRGFVYDAIYRLVSASGRECDRPLHLPWDEAPRCTDLTKTRAYLQRYVYDRVGNIQQVRHIANDGGFTRDFTLVPGNTAPSNNRLKQMSVGSTTFAYRYDDNRNMTDETTSRHFEWDHSDRMRVFRTQPVNAEPTVHVQYLYDSPGQRTVKLTRPSAGPVEVTIYIDGIFEHRKQISSAMLAENNSLHIMDNASRVALVRLGQSFGADATPPVGYQLADHLGSSNVAVGGQNATVDNFVNREEYTPFGETSFGSFARKRYRFSGKERDEETGFNYHGARYCAPALGRWVSCDPMIKLSNLYVYTKNNPLSYWDPSGQDDDELISGVFNYYDTHPASSNLQAPASPGSVAPSPWTSPSQSDETNGTNLSEGIQAYLQSQQNQLELEKKYGAIEQGSPRTYEEEVTAPVTHAASFAWKYPRLAPGIWRALREEALFQAAPLVLGALEGLITTGGETVLTEQGSATLAEATSGGNALISSQNVIRGGYGEAGVGTFYLKNAAQLTPEAREAVIAAIRDADFQAGISGGLIRQAGGDRAVENSVARLGRQALDLNETQAAGHIPDAAAGGSPFGPIQGIPKSVNSSWGGQLKRYAPGFEFTGFSLVDKSTGEFLYPSLSLEHPPAPILRW